MTENLFGYLRFLTSGLLLTAFLCAPVACTAHRDHKIAEMVKAGADPIAVGCAMPWSPPTPMCTAASTKGK